MNDLELLNRSHMAPYPTVNADVPINPFLTYVIFAGFIILFFVVLYILMNKE